MSHLIVAVLIYVAIVAIANQKPATVSATTRIDYFPEVEKIESDISGISELAIAAEISPVIPCPWELETTLEPVTETAIATVEPVKPTLYLLPPAKPVASDLNSLGIRELKRLASKAKIKRYSTLRRDELISRLSAIAA